MKATQISAKILFSLFYRVVSVLVASALLALSFIALKSIVDKEKASPFECGFDPRGITRLPFCIKFFMVSVIFLVFDIEVALILPMIFSGLTVITFLGILILGAVYEWAYGGLD